MTPKAATRAEAERLHAAFLAAGAVAVEADILLPAGTLLDLYGEDIRARAYVTADPLNGEMMLRPDFTVPVVQAHMAGGAEPARYAYMGEVFRRQEHLDGLRRHPGDGDVLRESWKRYQPGYDRTEEVQYEKDWSL